MISYGMSETDLAQFEMNFRYLGYKPGLSESECMNLIAEIRRLQDENKQLLEQHA